MVGKALVLYGVAQRREAATNVALEETIWENTHTEEHTSWQMAGAVVNSGQPVT